MADPYNINPYATQSGGATNSFEDWYNHYYGGNTSGYQPQKRLSDLAYQQPQQSSRMFTNLPAYQGQQNTTFIPQNSSYQETSQQPQQSSYQRPYTGRGRTLEYWTNYDGKYVPVSQMVNLENARTQGGRYVPEGMDYDTYRTSVLNRYGNAED